MYLNEIYDVDAEFTRSINVTADLENLDVAAQYVWTDSNRQTIERILNELAETRHASITLTGPFGTGKSAAILQLLHLFNLGGRGSAKRAQERFADAGGNEDVLERARCKNPPLPVVITGRQAPIHQVVLEGLQQAVKDHVTGGTKTTRRINKFLNDGEGSLQEIFEAVNEDVYGAYDGIFLIIDEFGKLLEFAALNQSDSDMYLLQQLAEMREANANGNFLLLTVLHQSFEGYARYLSQQKQNEWSKIQGRFLTLNLSEQPEELVPLVSKALQRRQKTIPRGVKGSIEKNRKAALVELRGTPTADGYKPKELKELVNNSYPFNPLAIMALPFLSKVAGQNSRSSFTFLGSHDPYSFREVISGLKIGTDLAPEVILADLYDYFSKTGFASQGSAGSRWNLVRVALDNLEDTSAVTIAVLKTIGVLNILQLPRQFRANESTLRAALHSLPNIDTALPQALEQLTKESKIAYRRFADEFRLWEGSDFNFDEEIAKRSDLPIRIERIIDHLDRLVPQHTIIARRHYEESGTLRFYHACYAGAEQITEKGVASLMRRAEEEGAEGVVALVLCTNTDEFEEAQATIKGKLQAHPTFVALMIKPRVSMLDMLREIIILEDIARNNSNLAGDAVARKELKDRIASAEDRLVQDINDTYWGFGEDVYISVGHEVRASLSSRRAFHSLLSETFNNVFNQSPVLRNELINRRAMPGTITSAVKGILQRLLEHAAEPNLGFEDRDFSASASIYRLLFRKLGIHRKGERGRDWIISHPSQEDWACVWDDMKKLFQEQAGKDLKLEDIYAHFGAAPYGIRQPVMALIFIAYLESNDNDVSLYEEGSFVARRDMESYEMLLRRPKYFSVRQLVEDEHSEEALKALEKSFGIKVIKGHNSTDRITEVIKALYHIYRQVPQVTLATKKIDLITQDFRNLVAKANRPEDLIYRDLPELFDCELPQDAKKCAKAIHQQLQALNDFTEKLITDCERTIAECFGVKRKSRNPRATLRKALTERCKAIADHVNDMEIRNFIIRVANQAPSEKEWLELVIGNIGKKKVYSWHDGDIDEFVKRTRLLSHSFKEYEKLVAENAQNNGISGTRFTVTSTTGSKVDQWVEADVNEPTDEVNNLVKKITTTIKKSSPIEQKAALLLALQEVCE